jgi:hypothetical protein
VHAVAGGFHFEISKFGNLELVGAGQREALQFSSAIEVTGHLAAMRGCATAMPPGDEPQAQRIRLTGLKEADFPVAAEVGTCANYD